MSVAFEVIEEDVPAALVKLDPKAKKFVEMYGLTPAKIFDRLHLGLVEKAALAGVAWTSMPRTSLPVTSRWRTSGIVSRRWTVTRSM